MWKSGPPRLPQGLQFLVGWSREDLIEVMARFRSFPKLSVQAGDLAYLLGRQLSEQEARDIFASMGAQSHGSLDFLSIVLPLVVMSNQSYISKVTFLFSIADLNASGSINRPEFYIGVRSLFKGMARFCPASAPPCGGGLEKAANAVFDRIDVNQSGLVELEEMLVYAYRSKGLRELVAPFPCQDQRDFEGLIRFARGNPQQERRINQKVDMHAKGLRKQIMLTPDPACVAGSPATWLTRRTKQRERPWILSAVVTKPRVYVMWWFFNKLKKGSQIQRSGLLELINDPRRLDEVLSHGAAELRPAELIHQSDTMAELKVVSYIKTHLCAASSVQRLKEQAKEEGLSLRALLSTMWLNVPEREINQGLKWCRQFQALAALKELLRPVQSDDVDPFQGPENEALHLNLTEDDVQALFDVIDQDGNGNLSITELVALGNLSGAEAKHLEKVWDRDRSGELSQEELLASIHGRSRELRGSIKGVFAASLLISGGLVPRAPPKPDGQFVRAVCC